MARNRNDLMTQDEIKKGTEVLRQALVFFKTVDEMASYLQFDRKSLYHYMKGHIPIPAVRALIVENLIKLRKQELNMIEITKEDLRPDLFKKSV